MTFPNASTGVKKIFTAQILRILSTVFLIVGAVSTLVTAALIAAENSEIEGPSVGLAVISVIFLVIGGVLAIIAFLMNIIGLRQAGTDEESLHMAFIVSIFALVISFVSTLFDLLNVGGGIADNIAEAVGFVCEIFVIISVIRGITNLADQLHNEKVASLGDKLSNVILVILILALIANTVPIFLGADQNVLTSATILEMVSLVLTAVGYVIYLVFLGKASNMLRTS